MATIATKKSQLPQSETSLGIFHCANYWLVFNYWLVLRYLVSEMLPESQATICLRSTQKQFFFSLSSLR